MYTLTKYIPLPPMSAEAGNSRQKASKKGRQEWSADASLEIGSKDFTKAGKDLREAGNCWFLGKGRQMPSYIAAKAPHVGNGRQRSANARKNGLQ
jgi:hypothetical protein